MLQVVIVVELRSVFVSVLLTKLSFVIVPLVFVYVMYITLMISHLALTLKQYYCLLLSVSVLVKCEYLHLN